MSQITEPLNARHRKAEFNCGKVMLDTYFHKQANQDVKRKLAVCFVLNDVELNLIKGYYTLANNSISQEFIPISIKKKLPKSYTSVPTTLLGRLAIDKRFQDKGIGKLLLMDALKRSLEASKTLASFAVIVDPIDSDAEAFYLKYGFVKLPDSGKMFMQMKTIRQLFE